MKAKKVDNFLFENDLEDILTEEPPSRYEGFEDDMTQWLKHSDYNAKEQAIDTFNFFKDVKDYVQAEFADWLRYKSLEEFRNDFIDLWRVGPIEGLTSFFLNKEAAESYAKRMRIFEPEHYQAKGEDIIPTLSGSQEVIVDEENIKEL